MRAITAHSTMASWLAGRRSWSRTQRRCVLIQAKVRSTTQRRGRTWKVCRRAAYDDDNIEHHSRLLVVQTPAVRAIITQGRRLAHLNRAAHYGRCGLIVSGPARTGKTTAITQLGKTIEVIHQRRHPRSGGDIPVIYITVPPAATPKMIAIEFARFLGLPVSRQANITGVIESVCGVCLDTNVTTVPVDELHNLNTATRPAPKPPTRWSTSPDPRHLHLRRDQPGTHRAAGRHPR